jgi:hypothetical protein
MNWSMNLLLIGVALTAISWLAAWSRNDLGIYFYSFFPLWIGYIVTVNGLAEVFFGTSLLKKLRRSFIALFILSVPLWWFFEYMNSIVHNWHYVFVEGNYGYPISTLQFDIQASIDFSVVIPAILSTAFFVYCCLLRANSDRQGRERKWLLWAPVLLCGIVLGALCYVVLPLHPKELFALVWIAPIFILEPIAYMAGLPGLLGQISNGEYKRAVSVMIGTLVTGFWWELWNFFSLPKWKYDIPYVGFWKIFELPLVGYFGYPFFGLCVFIFASIALYLTLRINLVETFSITRVDGPCRALKESKP